jgi:hypothetical protein
MEIKPQTIRLRGGVEITVRDVGSGGRLYVKVDGVQHCIIMSGCGDALRIIQSPLTPLLVPATG